ncbi:hypothetical protein BDR05DRAFT_1003408 [Suillus weaverae]|nr:hypothetical protein BDR05DRAFT_1003408 [Suillus weaverae]
MHLSLGLLLYLLWPTYLHLFLFSPLSHPPYSYLLPPNPPPMPAIPEICQVSNAVSSPTPHVVSSPPTSKHIDSVASSSQVSTTSMPQMSSEPTWESSLMKPVPPSECSIEEVVDWLKSKSFGQAVCHKFIVLISAQLKYNIDAVIVKRIPIPVHDFVFNFCLIVIHSFNVDKPGAEVDDLKGGIVDGSILTGILWLGQEVEICPGIVTKDTQGWNGCKPIFSRIVFLHAENNHLWRADQCLDQD